MVHVCPCLCLCEAESESREVSVLVCVIAAVCKVQIPHFLYVFVRKGFVLVLPAEGESLEIFETLNRKQRHFF